MLNLKLDNLNLLSIMKVCVIEKIKIFLVFIDYLDDNKFGNRCDVVFGIKYNIVSVFIVIR